MTLLVDLGNSRLKWALVAGRTIQSHGVIENTGVDALGKAWSRLSFKSLWLASVAERARAASIEDFARARGASVNRVVTQARFGRLINGYTDPAQLGVDRWMACVAAATMYTGALWIADAGTALTLDRIDADGRHRGGLIVPGVDSMRRTLTGSTQLPAVDAAGAGHDLGGNTQDAIAIGTRRAVVSLINETTRARPADHLLVTGGQAALVAPELEHAFEWVPDLVLRGIALHAGIGDAS